MDTQYNEKPKTGTRIKFVIVGDKKVGKTTIVNHYTKNKIKREYQETIGKEIYKGIAKINQKNYIIKIIDIPNNKQFLDIIKKEYENSICALIVFDITNWDSFLSLNDWINHCRSSQNKNLDLILIGNKSDLNQNRVVSMEEAIKFATDNNINYFEISAYNKKNIENVFNNAISNLFNKNNDVASVLSSDTLIGSGEGSQLTIKLNIKKKRNDCICCS